MVVYFFNSWLCKSVVYIVPKIYIIMVSGGFYIFIGRNAEFTGRNYKYILYEDRIHVPAKVPPQLNSNMDSKARINGSEEGNGEIYVVKCTFEP